jgi:hypothetical protein
MTHHRDARAHQGPDLRQPPAAAFELDRLRATLLEVPHRIRQRHLRAGLVTAERQVSHDERHPRAAHHRRHHRDQLIHGHRQRVLVTQDHLAAGVTDQ